MHRCLAVLPQATSAHVHIVAMIQTVNTEVAGYGCILTRFRCSSHLVPTLSVVAWGCRFESGLECNIWVGIPRKKEAVEGLVNIHDFFEI